MTTMDYQSEAQQQAAEKANPAGGQSVGQRATETQLSSRPVVQPKANSGAHAIACGCISCAMPVVQRMQLPVIQRASGRRSSVKKAKQSEVGDHNELSEEEQKKGRVRRAVPSFYGDDSGIGIGHYGSSQYTGVPTVDVFRKFTVADKTAVNKLGDTYGCHGCGIKGDSGWPDGHWTPDHQPPLSIYKAETGTLVGYSGHLYPHCKACSSKQGGLLSKK